MTLSRFGSSLTPLALHTPIRPIIGAASGARRRLPVPLVWRARCPADVDAGEASCPVTGRINHFHHWSMSIGIDWRIGATTLLRTISPSLCATPTTMWEAAPSPFAPRPTAILQFRQRIPGSQIATSRRTGTLRRVTTGRELVTHRDRLCREPATQHTMSHHGVIRHWRTQRYDANTTILSSTTQLLRTETAVADRPRRTSAILLWPEFSATLTPSLFSTTHLRRTEGQTAVADRPRRTSAILMWPEFSAKITPSHRTTLRLTAPRPTVALIASSAPPPNRIVRPIPLIWRGGESAPLTFEAARSAARTAASHAAQPVRPAHVDHTAAPITVRNRISVTLPASPSAPDMTRLVDEVMRRIERQARSERQRRGL